MAQLQLATTEEKAHNSNVAVLDFKGEVKAKLCLGRVGLSTGWDFGSHPHEKQ